MKVALILTTILAAGANLAAAVPQTTSTPTSSAVSDDARAKGIAEAINHAIRTSKVPFPQANLPQPNVSSGHHKRCDSNGYWNCMSWCITASWPMTMGCEWSCGSAWGC